MKIQAEKFWLIATFIFAAAAAVAAAELVLAVADGKNLLAAICVIALAIFAACIPAAWTLRSKMSEVNKAEDEINCLRLKRPGLERGQEAEIVPKGKIPKG
jgi:uncharacterized membrane protein YqjE